MKKLCSLIALVAGVAIQSFAQRSAGDLGLGLRLTPDGGGFTAKYFVDRNVALEGQLNAGGIFAFEGESFTVVGLVQYHISFPDPAWKLFFGGGAHIGAWDRGRYRDNDFLFGLDGVGGVEYRFSKIPLALTVDFKPAVNFAPEIDFFMHNAFGAAARFYLR